MTGVRVVTDGRYDDVRRLRALDPVDEGALRRVSAADRQALAGDLAGDGDVVVVPSRRGSRGGSGWRVLAAAAAAAVLVGGTALAAGGDGARLLLSVAGEPQPDRAHEDASHEAWVADVVACLQDEYGQELVTSAPGGYRYDEVAAVAAADGGDVSFSDRACVRAAGPEPVRAPMTTRELGRFHDELRSTALCLLERGHDVGAGPSHDEFVAQWAAPDRAPWTPYADVPDADVAAAEEACGVPVPPAAPAWLQHAPPVLDVRDTMTPTRLSSTRTVMVFTESDSGGAVAGCLQALGLDALSAGGGYTLETPVGEQEAVDDAVRLCHERYAGLPRPELTPEQLGRLYDWYVEVSVPCLEQAGVEVAEAPSRGEFVATYGQPRMWLPYVSVPAHDVASLERRCPQGPSQEWLYPGSATDPGD